MSNGSNISPHIGHFTLWTGSGRVLLWLLFITLFALVVFAKFLFFSLDFSWPFLWTSFDRPAVFVGFSSDLLPLDMFLTMFEELLLSICCIFFPFRVIDGFNGGFSSFDKRRFVSLSQLPVFKTDTFVSWLIFLCEMWLESLIPPSVGRVFEICEFLERLSFDFLLISLVKANNLFGWLPFAWESKSVLFFWICSFSTIIDIGKFFWCRFTILDSLHSSVLEQPICIGLFGWLNGFDLSMPEGVSAILVWGTEDGPWFFEYVS